jgi:hypothetical protein
MAATILRTDVRNGPGYRRSFLVHLFAGAASSGSATDISKETTTAAAARRPEKSAASISHVRWEFSERSRT